MAIIGQSGSGKSTFMNMLGCLDVPTSGKYYLNGTDVSEMSDNELSEVRNREIGFIFQGFNLIANLNAIENVELPLIYRGIDRKTCLLYTSYALQAGYSVSKDSIAHETSDSEAAKTYVNIIAVKEGNEDNEAVKALVDVLKSDEIKDYINETYDGAVVPFEESADSDKAEAVDATADAEEDTAAEDAE